LSLVLGLMVALAFPTAAIFAWQNGRGDVAPSPPELARDAAIDYALRNYQELKGVLAPSSWETRDLTPGLCGASNLQYTGDGWTVNVSYPVVLHPEYIVEIEFAGEVSFHWKGTVDQDGNVTVD